MTIAEVLGSSSSDLSPRSAVFAVKANDLISVRPARIPACAATQPIGCTTFAYDGSTHHLAWVGDPRRDAGSDNRWEVTWSSLGAPVAVLDRSHGGAAQVNILDWDTGDSTKGRRVLWQDAAAAAKEFADLHRHHVRRARLYDYVPLSCTGQRLRRASPRDERPGQRPCARRTRSTASPRSPRRSPTGSRATRASARSPARAPLPRRASTTSPIRWRRAP